jgi:SAM-dependent methyltransferase
MMAELRRRARRIPSRLRRWGWRRFVLVLGLTAVETVRLFIWDFWHGIETRNQVPLDQLGIENTCYGHRPADHVYSGWNGDYTCASLKFPKLLRQLNLDWTSFTYLDLGSGKGKSLFTAAELPFAKVIGVELSEKLVHLARQNLSRHRNFKLKCNHIEVVFADALEYEFPADPLVIYSLNTFPPAIMRAILENLKRSLWERPREVYILWMPTPPEIYALFVECGFLQEIESGRDYTIYRTSRASPGFSSSPIYAHERV